MHTQMAHLDYSRFVTDADVLDHRRGFIYTGIFSGLCAALWFVPSFVYWNESVTTAGSFMACLCLAIAVYCYAGARDEKLKPIIPGSELDSALNQLIDSSTEAKALRAEFSKLPRKIYAFDLLTLVRYEHSKSYRRGADQSGCAFTEPGG